MASPISEYWSLTKILMVDVFSRYQAHMFVRCLLRLGLMPPSSSPRFPVCPQRLGGQLHADTATAISQSEWAACCKVEKHGCQVKPNKWAVGWVGNILTNEYFQATKSILCPMHGPRRFCWGIPAIKRNLLTRWLVSWESKGTPPKPTPEEIRP